MTILEEVVSSRARLLIADLLSVRPRTLGELAEKAGISVQGVLKHLKKIGETGMLRETELRGKEYVSIRKVYSMANGKIGDYSSGDFLIAHLSRGTPRGGEGLSSPGFDGLESLSEDILVQRRRIRTLGKRMEKMVMELEACEERLSEAILTQEMSSELKLIALTLFSEDDEGEARRVILKHYGCDNADEAIAAAIAGLRRSGTHK